MADLETPPFLAWTLALPCALKEFDGWDQPERAERHLRTARVFGESLAAGNCHAERCYDRQPDPTAYFEVAESLRIYGGADSVLRACTGCPAHVLERSQIGGLAGCYGEASIPEPAGRFYAEMERALSDVGTVSDFERLFRATFPRWFGLWLNPIDRERAAFLSTVLGNCQFVRGRSAWTLFQQALEMASCHDFPLHARLYPRGLLGDRQWRLAPYCVYCSHEIEDFRLPCPCCGAERLPVPPLRRHVRGNRPWRALKPA